LSPAFIQECERAGLIIEQLRAGAGFCRFRVADTTDETLVDFAWDARIRPPLRTRYGPVLDHEELAADKMLALFGRAAPRDFVDVYRLRDLYNRDRLCELAVEKDRGFDRSVFADMTTRLTSYERHDFPVDAETLEAMHQEFDAWRHELQIEPEQLLDIEAPELEL
jgi:predicted nucleotidyltransferase component of viral defense system